MTMTKKEAATFLRRLPADFGDQPYWDMRPGDLERLGAIADLLDPPANQIDKRTAERLIRIRLYRRGAEEPDADSEAQGHHPAPPDAPGTWAVGGLPGVAGALASTAAAFHTDDPISGLDRATLLRRIKGFRTTLSRNGGTAVWRVPYTVDGAAWDARVDVVNA